MVENIITSVLSMTSAGFLLAGIIYFIMGIFNLVGRAGSNASATASNSISGISASGTNASNSINQAMDAQNKRLATEGGLERVISKDESQEGKDLNRILQDVDQIALDFQEILGIRKKFFGKNNAKKAELDLQKRISDIMRWLKDFIDKEREERVEWKALFEQVVKEMQARPDKNLQAELDALQGAKEAIKEDNNYIGLLESGINTALQEVTSYFSNDGKDKSVELKQIKDSLQNVKTIIERLKGIIQKKKEYEIIEERITRAEAA